MCDSKSEFMEEGGRRASIALMLIVYSSIGVLGAHSLFWCSQGLCAIVHI